MSVLVTFLKQQGVERVIEDSSGNAAASIAGYAARAGIACTVYAPATASPGKLVQAAAFGADVRPVTGTRDDVARAAETAAGQPGASYATHNWHPLFIEGVKTWAFEIWEQLGFARTGCHRRARRQRQRDPRRVACLLGAARRRRDHPHAAPFRRPGSRLRAPGDGAGIGSAGNDTLFPHAIDRRGNHDRRSGPGRRPNPCPARLQRRRRGDRRAGDPIGPAGDSPPGRLCGANLRDGGCRRPGPAGARRYHPNRSSRDADDRKRIESDIGDRGADLIRGGHVEPGLRGGEA